jgi:formylglycine-generating enzyme required for sulfatase activity
MNPFAVVRPVWKPIILATALFWLPSSAGAEEPAKVAAESLRAPFDASTAKAAQQQWAKRLKSEVVETNSIGMKLTLIPPGEFTMGSPERETDRRTDEKQHLVRITKPFYLGTYAVTQSEYERLVGTNPSWLSSTGGGKEKVNGWDTSRFPVEKVSWDDAVEFCRILSAKEGKTYRLPTEAEWEYACRAGTTTPFSFGSSLNGRQANCNGNYPYGTEEKGPFVDDITPVGKYPSNAFGLYDMHGNAWQWCQDWYGLDYHSNSPTDDPQGPTSGALRVFRGGCWYDSAVFCRSARRNGGGPASRFNDLGFRVARVPHGE